MVSFEILIVNLFLSVMKKTSIYTNIQGNLKRYMKDKALTIKDLEELSGVSEPTIKRLRTRPVSPNTSIDVLHSLASALGITIMDLTAPPCDSTYEEEAQGKNNEEDTFVYRFKKPLFDFEIDDRALFKKYAYGTSITKFFFDNKFELYQLISQNENSVVAKNQHNEICSLSYTDIMATISKKYFNEDKNG